ncbi:MAG TPA: XdhC family protein [Candidatus Deferrimicrobium sp.]|nr:XdhC family protein [Candidatus Deferrimicrobium sp.]
MQEIYAAALKLIRENQPGVIGTVVEGIPERCPTGTKFICDSAINDVLKVVDPGLLASLQAGIAEVLEQKSPKLIVFNWQNSPVKVFLDPFKAHNNVVICGGGHIALPLVSMSKLLNYRVTVIDDRLSFANRERFPLADQVICGDFKQAIRDLEVGPSTCVVIVTRGHRHDRTCLTEILKGPRPGYLGMIGSRKKVLAVMQYLRETGFEEEVLKDVHSPIGLDIGAETPEEIAVSIMAEIIMLTNRGSRPKNLPKWGESSGL